MQLAKSCSTSHPMLWVSAWEHLENALDKGMNDVIFFLVKLLIEIPDKQAVFGMKVLKSLSFIKKAKPMSDSAFSLWNDLKEANSEVKLHKQGKIKLKTAQELLNEL